MFELARMLNTADVKGERIGPTPGRRITDRRARMGSVLPPGLVWEVFFLVGMHDGEHQGVVVRLGERLRNDGRLFVPDTLAVSAARGGPEHAISEDVCRARRWAVHS